MKYCLKLLYIVNLAAVLPFAALARQATTYNSLNDTQSLGRRIFQQRCGVCHGESTITSKRNGPALYKDLIDGNEDTVRETITKGRPGVMPGFQYGLNPSEVSALIEYLKTVPRPTKPAVASNGVDVKD